MKLSYIAFIFSGVFSSAHAQNTDYQPHYLVGLLNDPNSRVPDVLKNHTSGKYFANDRVENWLADSNAPYTNVPKVGYSDIEFYYDENGEKVLGEFFCLTDNGYGSSHNSADYPLNLAHLRIQKPFAYGHGGAGLADAPFDIYTEVTALDTVLIHDPHELIKWENGADIQVVYKVPDDTWADYKTKRVLTGRDLDPEGLAVINQTCAIMGDELMPSVIMLNPTTGEILSPFVRTPDIDEKGNFIDGKFLSTRSDKIHCDVADLVDDADKCVIVDKSVAEKSDYVIHHKSGGYEGFAKLEDGSIAAFLELKVRADEPGPRVYNVKPGNCQIGDKPSFESFRGYYPFEFGATNIADVSSIPGSSNLVLVIERNGYPGLGYPTGHMFPGPVMPANKLCLVDLTNVDENMIMRGKKCILNYHIISDPWDVDHNGISRYAQTQVTNEQVIVVDDYCIVAGTDTNYPWTNQLDVNLTSIPFAQEVDDARFMVVCFEEPIFNIDFKLLDDTPMDPDNSTKSDAPMDSDPSPKSDDTMDPDNSTKSDAPSMDSDPSPKSDDTNDSANYIPSMILPAIMTIAATFVTIL